VRVSGCAGARCLCAAREGASGHARGMDVAAGGPGHRTNTTNTAATKCVDSAVASVASVASNATSDFVVGGGAPAARAPRQRSIDASFRGSGLHSSTFQLNLSAFCGIRGARRGCVARVKGCLGCVGCFLVSDTAQVELRSGRV
jgi:hypothetical protein